MTGASHSESLPKTIERLTAGLAFSNQLYAFRNGFSFVDVGLIELADLREGGARASALKNNHGLRDESSQIERSKLHGSWMEIEDH